MKKRFGRGAAALLAAGLLAAMPLETMALLKPDVSTTKPWDQLEINQQYSEFVREAGTYSVQDAELTSDQIGDDLGAVLTVGVSNKMNRFTHNARIYIIDGIASKCAVAVKYDGDDRYFVSTNRNYTPATLGALIEDLSLEDTLSAGEISYTYWKDNVQKKGNHVTERYSLDDASVIWEMLLADTSLPVAKEVPNPLVGVMSVTVDIGTIEETGTALSVTTDGYMQLYALGSGKVFFPGKQTTQKFIKYVQDNAKSLGRTTAGDDGPSEGSSLLGAKSVIK